MAVFAGNPDLPQPLMLTNNGRGAAIPLPAGINTLQVVRQLAIGTPPPRTVIESNLGSFILQPVIRGAPNEPIAVGPTAGGITPITVPLDPIVMPTQHVTLLLNQMNLPAGATPVSYSFDAAASGIAANVVIFPTRNVGSGRYLVRVRIDGAESPLRTDPTSGRFVGPQVTI